MAKEKDPFVFSDLTKMMNDFKVPGVNWHDLLESQQKNISALTRANQLLLEGAQAVVQRQVDILRKSMEELRTASQEMMKEGDPASGTEKRFELAKVSFEGAISNMRELADLAGKANAEALEVINKRAMEGFEEIKAAIQARRS